MSVVDGLMFDTNVLVYNFDHADPQKAKHVQSILPAIFAAGKPLVSTQVLSEFYWNVTRKIPVPLSHKQAAAETAKFANLTRVLPITWDVIEKGLDAVVVHQMAYWDALIFAAAAINGASTILSEDFQHRCIMEGITFLNPFADDFDLAALLGS